MEHHEISLEKFTPTLEFCNVQNQIWLEALYVECASFLKWYLVEFTLHFTPSFFLLKPKRLVTKILEGAISQICPYAYFQKSCYCCYYYYCYFLSKVKEKNFNTDAIANIEIWNLECMKFAITIDLPLARAHHFKFVEQDFSITF